MVGHEESRSGVRHLRVAPPVPAHVLELVDETVSLEEVSEDLAADEEKLDAFLASYPASVRLAVIEGTYRDAVGELRTTYGMLCGVDAEVTEPARVGPRVDEH